MTALAEVAAYLRCPVCASPLAGAEGMLRCAGGHAFDVARQGYVNLLGGRQAAGADTPAMVAARVEVLAAGHLDLLTRALTDAVGAMDSVPPGLVVDVGAGTGHHLAAVLDHQPDRFGLALDSSTAAARRAARAHPRLAAAVCDAWRGLPLLDSCAGLVLNVFAPRNGAEFRRVLRPGGRLLVLTPEPQHLSELIPALGLLTVDPDKPRRLDVTLGRWFRLVQSQEYAASLRLDRRAVANLVAMGPNAWHSDPAGLAERISGLPEPIAVTVAVRLRVYDPGD